MKIQGIAFETSKFTSADLKVDSAPIKGFDKQNEGFCTILYPERPNCRLGSVRIIATTVAAGGTWVVTKGV